MRRPRKRNAPGSAEVELVRGHIVGELRRGFPCVICNDARPALAIDGRASSVDLCIDAAGPRPTPESVPTHATRSMQPRHARVGFPDSWDQTRDACALAARRPTLRPARDVSPKLVASAPMTPRTGTYFDEREMRMAQTPAGPPAGWYPDPAGSGLLRYYDGRVWDPRLRDPASGQLVVAPLTLMNPAELPGQPWDPDEEGAAESSPAQHKSSRRAGWLIAAGSAVLVLLAIAVWPDGLNPSGASSGSASGGPGSLATPTFDVTATFPEKCERFRPLYAKALQQEIKTQAWARAQAQWPTAPEWLNAAAAAYGFPELAEGPRNPVEICRFSRDQYEALESAYVKSAPELQRVPRSVEPDTSGPTGDGIPDPVNETNVRLYLATLSEGEFKDECTTWITSPKLILVKFQRSDADEIDLDAVRRVYDEVCGL